MADQILDLSTLPDANPAVAVSGWRYIAGSSTVARVDNGSGFFSTDNAWSGWEYLSNLIPASNIVSAENTYVLFVNSDGDTAVVIKGTTGGYMLVTEAFNVRLWRIGSNINSAPTSLGSVSRERFVNDDYKLTYNVSTGELIAYCNNVSVLTRTDTTYASETFLGGFASRGFRRAGVSSATIYNVAAAASVTIATPLTPSASRTDTCAGFTDGAATLTFSGVSVPVTIASGSFTWTVPMLADGVVWPRLPATGQTITLTQGGTTANTTANINLPTGHQTLRVGDVIGGAVANFASIVTDNDRMLGYHFVAAANPLATTKTAYFTTANSYWVYRNGDVGASTYVDGTEDDPTPVPALPRTDTLYIQEANGLISAHEVTLTAVGVVTEDTTPNSFTFTAETGANINTGYTSNQITISGLGTGVAATLTVTNGTYSKNGGVFTSTADVISNGDTLRVRGTSSANYSTAVTVSVTVGTYTTSYSITTKVDNEPDNINFVTLSALSNIETVEGVTGSVPISITGGQYSKNSGAFTSTAGTVVNTDTIQLSAANGATVIVTIGSKTFSWSSVGSGTSGIKRSIIHAIK